jgi:hypothetical protein
MPLRIRFCHTKPLVIAETPLSGTNLHQGSATHCLPASSSPNGIATISVREKPPVAPDAPVTAARGGGLRRRFPSQPLVRKPFAQVEIEVRVSIFMPNPVPILANEIALLGPGLSEFLSGDIANDNGGT